MKLYVQFMIILLFSIVGEVISVLFHLPVPGSIIGLILLFIALQLKIIRLRHIHTVGTFLLDNMTILFLPASVGVMQYVDVIVPNLFPLVLIVLGALIINLMTMGLVVSWIKHQFEGDYEG